MPMSPEIEQRIARSFEAQGLMATLGARLAWVGDGEVHIAGRLLTVCSGEVRAFLSEGASEYKVVALMQATMVLVRA